ncbi:hypothetical protein A3Q56_02973 [Intoshia linei]|uniref:Fork-head domain-containing protein n=1 Tax=Intoshia linei TaxID=1819745 RepID=A0A177B4V2_9BILA|nr:hypothetical protein A3Q56_02973 [Intoshia linei]
MVSYAEELLKEQKKQIPCDVIKLSSKKTIKKSESKKDEPLEPLSWLTKIDNPNTVDIDVKIYKERKRQPRISYKEMILASIKTTGYMFLRTHEQTRGLHLKEIVKWIRKNYPVYKKNGKAKLERAIKSCLSLNGEFYSWKPYNDYISDPKIKVWSICDNFNQFLMPLNNFVESDNSSNHQDDIYFPNQETKSKSPEIKELNSDEDKASMFLLDSFSLKKIENNTETNTGLNIQMQGPIPQSFDNCDQFNVNNLPGFMGPQNLKNNDNIFTVPVSHPAEIEYHQMYDSSCNEPMLTHDNNGLFDNPVVPLSTYMPDILIPRYHEYLQDSAHFSNDRLIHQQSRNFEHVVLSENYNRKLYDDPDSNEYINKWFQKCSKVSSKPKLSPIKFMSFPKHDKSWYNETLSDNENVLPINTYNKMQKNVNYEITETPLPDYPHTVNNICNQFDDMENQNPFIDTRNVYVAMHDNKISLLPDKGNYITFKETSTIYTSCSYPVTCPVFIIYYDRSIIKLYFVFFGVIIFRDMS